MNAPFICTDTQTVSKEAPLRTSYMLRCHTMENPDLEPCRSYDLIVSNVSGTALLPDLTVREESAMLLLNLFYEENVLPENLPWIAEDLLSDPEFVD